jgi:inhibitor of the pro-sigma K processing machinery
VNTLINKGYFSKCNVDGGKNVEYVILLIVVLLGLFAMIKFFSWPGKIIRALFLNTILGIILLFIINAVGSNFDVHIGINLITVLIAGFFGIPGAIFLVVLKLYL